MVIAIGLLVPGLLMVVLRIFFARGMMSAMAASALLAFRRAHSMLVVVCMPEHTDDAIHPLENQGEAGDQRSVTTKHER